MENLSAYMGRMVWGGDAERFHTHKTIRTETVHHHSAMVGHFAMLLCPKQFQTAARFAILVSALKHDLGEGSNNGGGVAAAGDIPSPVKRAVPGMKEASDAYEEQLMRDDGHRMPMLSAPEYRILKLADNMAGMTFCIQERFLGNKLSEYAYRVYEGYLDDADMDENQALVYGELKAWWSRANV